MEFVIPQSLKLEHEELHAELVEATTRRTLRLERNSGVSRMSRHRKLRVGSGGVFWTDAIQGAREVKKEWEPLIRFMKSP